jgi:hypothetical protein
MVRSYLDCWYRIGSPRFFESHHASVSSFLPGPEQPAMRTNQGEPAALVVDDNEDGCAPPGKSDDAVG